ncbi:unnamed protein product [Brassicogethes aeneus]|uniref:Major facilitator superfamily (MFS) profile domain-containing protein n=1 Tax=Brassicogethes aeneus TaxID=1431903 RepID=A0A9P0AY15_BRAAE|nr:unnamed protein product [Brassicogethes aeneus]
MAPPNVTDGNDNGYRMVPSNEPEENYEKVQNIEETDKDVAKEKEKHLFEKAPLKEDSEPEAAVVVPPDGGWGWVIVVASFMCNMVVDGIIFSFGAFLPGIAESFDVSKASVTLVGSLMSGFYLISGPFASALANRYGFQLVAIVGSVLGTTAFAISYFATNVQFLCISYGVLGGIGFGLIYVPSVITVGFYFERWRALATGIAVCGSGIGTFLFAPLSKWMIEKMGWRTSLLFQGAIVLSCVLYGLAFKPLKPTKIKDIDEADGKELVMDPSKLPVATKVKMEEAMRRIRRGSTVSAYDHQTSISRMLGVNNNSDYPRVSDVYQTINIPSRKILETYIEKRLSVPSISEKDKPKSYDLKQNLLEGKNPIIIVPKRNRTTSQNEESEVNRPLYRDDIFFCASLKRLPQYTSRTSIAYNLAVTRLPTKNDVEEEIKHTCKLCPEAVKRTLATMLDYSLLKSPSFILLSVGGFLTMMGFYVPFMYLVDRATFHKMDLDTAVWLVSSIGIANTFGRVMCGVLSSFPSVNALLVTNVALTIGGVATIFSGISMTTEYQFFYAVVFGLSIACFASLRSIIVVDLLGLEKLTNAFGLLLLFQGVAAIIGAPLAGAFRDYTGGYEYSFYLSGSMLLSSAVICYPLNYLNKWEKKRNNKLQREKTVPV